MHIFKLIVPILILGFFSCQEPQAQEETPWLSFSINGNVENSEEAYFQEIDKLWQDFLLSREYYQRDAGIWNTSIYDFPQYTYIQLLMALKKAHQDGEKIHAVTFGIIPVEKDYYQIKTAFASVDTDAKDFKLPYITTVFAKKIKDRFLLVCGTEYAKDIYENKKVGAVNYVIHPMHKLNMEEAEKMNAFNVKMAEAFQIDPIEFDYVVANNTGDLSKTMGYDLNPYSYKPVQSGGMADNYNVIIYAGNNAAYYPHEVVHLYTYRKFGGGMHRWVDEGIAAFFGGSTGYELEWHLQKLKIFLDENPDYPLKELSELEKTMPNGEFYTDFRYAIGGYFIQQIFKREGMEGLFAAMQIGKENENYFSYLEQKFGFTTEEFESYIRATMKERPLLSDEEMDQLKY